MIDQMHNKLSRPTLALLLSLTAAVAATTGVAEDAAGKPNVVLILADDLGFSDISPYGAEVQTPHLQRLADEGLRFTQMHNTSKCFPSRACLLTGVYAQQCDMWRRNGDINHAITLGEALQTAGYLTIAVGKHHGTENLYRRGFDHYYGLRGGATNYFNPGNRRPFDPGDPALKKARMWCFDEAMVQPYTPEDPDFYTTDTFTDWAIELLGEHEADQRPFFLYLAYNAPHDPLHAWPEDIQKYEGVYDEGYAAIRTARYRRQLESGLLDASQYPLSAADHRQWDQLSEDEKADQVRRMQVYAAMIDRMDQNIGRLLETLRSQDRLDNTLVLFASDNGASAEVVRIGSGPIGSMTRWASLEGDWANVGNTPFRRYKNHSFEGGICTPMIAWWPGVIGPGRVTDFPSHFIDLMPTLVDLAGATYPSQHDGKPVVPMQGVSLRPVFEDQDLRRDKPMHWQWGKGKAVRHDGWKLIQQGGGPWELYHMPTDATETRDVATVHPDKVKELTRDWQQWWDQTASYREH